MEAELARMVRQAAADARRRAMGFPGSTSGDDLPWAVTKAFDDSVRGHVERDPGIEDERDGVLVAAVDLAESDPEDGDEMHPMLRKLLDAIDSLERVTLSRGVVNRKAAAAGYGTAGQRLAPAN
ncbi:MULTISPECIES: hypothetical protein [unclassified Methylobacterium]|uniref:hypothetical protein n=1 Tax=unclassified Methylobacterium TaxID=2615210 RepID=UPI0006F341B5|nr:MULTISPECIES: hypothetical protein [unclassified Methylobacterium]KQP54993.1 hypothetical protein ASF39_04430 [Methylobacterium sp. Leaf108]KQT78965.1 hypothetical protein ASG59_07335 [Methylobacterium sp. Leaf466]